jgi:hypothetical protein
VTFIPELVRLTEVGGESPDDWSMTAALEWTGRFRGNVGRVSVPASDSAPFETDLASVPRALTWLVPRYGLHTKAAILHDYLCQKAKDETVEVFLTPGTASKRGVSPSHPDVIRLQDRSDADEIFRMAMFDLGVPFWRRWMMWSAVGWATLLTSLRTGRSSQPRVLRWIGLAIVVAAAVLAAFFFVWSGAAGSIVGDAGWRWLRIIVAVLVVLLVGAAAAAAAILPGGYVAQGRWDRAPEYAFALFLTVALLPVLPVAAAAALIALVLYEPAAVPGKARSERIRAVRES